MKSVHQILTEYRNRQKDPQYVKIHVCNNLNHESMHTNVSNIEITQSDGVKWLEFDHSIETRKHHARIRDGYITEYHEHIKE